MRKASPSSFPVVFVRSTFPLPPSFVFLSLLNYASDGGSEEGGERIEGEAPGERWEKSKRREGEEMVRKGNGGESESTSHGLFT